MSDINTINVGGLDYSIEDETARETATSAVAITAYKEDGNTASQAYSVIGTPINWKGALYYTTASIAAGATLAEGTNLTAASNIGQMISNIKTYVGSDSKLHFRDATGADSVLPFSGSDKIIYIGTYGGYTGSVSIDVKPKVSDYASASVSDFFAGTAYANAYINGGTQSAVPRFSSYDAATGTLILTGVLAGSSAVDVYCGTLVFYRKGGLPTN